MKNMFLLFNHTITGAQETDAWENLDVRRIISLPAYLETTWNQIPPDLAEIDNHLDSVKKWLAEQSEKGDYVLIQGDFGACFIMVNFAFQNSLIPVYSTSRREAEEKLDTDGSVKLTHHFKHVAFRRYGA